MFMRIFVFTLLLSCVSVVAQTNEPTDADIAAAIDRKNYKEAIALTDLYLEKHYNDAKTYFHRGYCFLMIGKPNLALVDFNKALNIDSTLHEAYFNRALAHQALKNFTFAEADFLTYSAQKPEDEKAYLNLGFLYEEMEDLKAAIKAYTSYLALKPSSTEVLKYRALAFAATDSVNKAISDYNRCAVINPNDSSLWLLKGNVYYDAGRYTEAIEAYNLALLNYPGQRDALANRADAYTASLQYENAINDYMELALREPRNPDCHFNIGFCYLQQGKPEECIKSFEKAIDYEYENLGLLLTLRGVAYNNLQMKTEACADWQKAFATGYKEAAKYMNNYCN